MTDDLQLHDTLGAFTFELDDCGIEQAVPSDAYTGERYARGQSNA